MQRTEIPRPQWPRFIEAASAALTGDEVSIEIRAHTTRTEAWRLLRGLSYEIGDDVIWIHTDQMEHEVVRPRRLESVEDGRRLVALVLASDDATWVLRFRVPALSS